MQYKATVTYSELDQLLLGQMGAIIVANDLDAIFGHLAHVWESEMRNGNVTVNVVRTADHA